MQCVIHPPSTTSSYVDDHVKSRAGRQIEEQHCDKHWKRKKNVKTSKKTVSRTKNWIGIKTLSKTSYNPVFCTKVEGQSGRPLIVYNLNRCSVVYTSSELKHFVPTNYFVSSYHNKACGNQAFTKIFSNTIQQKCKTRKAFKSIKY